LYRIHTLPLKAYHGAIWRLKEGLVVQLRDGDTSAGRRFALFHETFHILAHCRGTPVFKKRGLEQGSFNELLADYFAGYILMPREWVKEKWTEIKDLDRMAEIFAVSKSAMCIRLKWLDLI
jgi:Zn-dependent peptidase ImmA (M78 family)